MFTASAGGASLVALIILLLFAFFIWLLFRTFFTNKYKELVEERDQAKEQAKLALNEKENLLIVKDTLQEEKLGLSNQVILLGKERDKKQQKILHLEGENTNYLSSINMFQPYKAKYETTDGQLQEKNKALKLAESTIERLEREKQQLANSLQERDKKIKQQQQNIIGLRVIEDKHALLLPAKEKADKEIIDLTNKLKEQEERNIRKTKELVNLTAQLDKTEKNRMETVTQLAEKNSLATSLQNSVNELSLIQNAYQLLMPKADKLATEKESLTNDLALLKAAKARLQEELAEARKISIGQETTIRNLQTTLATEEQKAAELSATNKDLQDDVQRVENDYTKLSLDFSATVGKLESDKKQLIQNEAAVRAAKDTLVGYYNTLKEEFKGLESKHEHVKVALADSQQLNTDQKEEIASLLYSVNILNNTKSYITEELGQSTSLLRQVEQDKLNQVKSLEATIAGNKQTIQTQTEEIGGLHASANSLLALKDNLANELNQANELLNKVEQDKIKQVNSLENTIAEQQSKINDLAKAIVEKEAAIQTQAEEIGALHASANSLLALKDNLANELNQANELLNKVEQDKINQVNSLENTIAGQESKINDLAKAIVEKETTIQTQTEEIGELHASANSLLALKANLASELNQTNGLLNIVEQDKIKQVNGLEATITNNSQTIARQADDIIRLHNSVDSLENLNNNLANELNQVNELLNKVEKEKFNQVSSLEIIVKENEQTIQTQTEEIGELHASVNSLLALKNNLANELSQANGLLNIVEKDKINQVNSLEDKVTGLDTVILGYNSQVNDLTLSLQSLSTTKEELETALTDKNALLQTLQTENSILLTNLNKATQQTATLEDKLTQQKVGIQEIKDKAVLEMNELENTILNHEISLEENQSTIEQLNAEKNVLHQQLEQVKDELSKVSLDVNTLQTNNQVITNELEKANGLISSLEQEASNKAVAFEQLNNTIDNQATRINELLKAQETLADQAGEQKAELAELASSTQSLGAIKLVLEKELSIANNMLAEMEKDMIDQTTTLSNQLKDATYLLDKRTADLTSERDMLYKSLGDYRIRVKQLDAKIEQLSRQSTQLAEDKKDLLNEKNLLTTALGDANSELETYQAEVIDLKKGLEQLVVDKHQLQEVINIHIVDIQKLQDKTTELTEQQHKLAGALREKTETLTNTKTLLEECQANQSTATTSDRNIKSAENEVVDFSRIGFATEDNKDDLKKIKGIGAFIEQKLNALGIYKFRQIANFTKDDEDKVTEAIKFFKGRIGRDEWVKQAGILTKKSS